MIPGVPETPPSLCVPVGGGGGEKVNKKVNKKVINRRKRSQTPFTAWVGAAETPSHSPK